MVGLDEINGDGFMEGDIVGLDGFLVGSKDGSKVG